MFSFFRDVLDTVQEHLGDVCVGQINGSVGQAARQQLIDQLTDRGVPGVLLGQIGAAGQGLNIQAASVVILCEPQWRPTIEQQAIARCFRMKQENHVDVYRLLNNDTIDEAMSALLKSKKMKFDEYARPSYAKESSSEAVDDRDLDIDLTKAEISAASSSILEQERRRYATSGN